MGGDDFLNQLPEHIFDMLFAGRSRPNCYFCFYQRRYEWVWLLWTHPDLFAEAERLELMCAGDKRENPFYWIGKDFPLSIIRENADFYFKKRVKQLVKFIRSNSQLNLIDPMTNPFIQAMQSDVTRSCGFFCGK